MIAYTEAGLPETNIVQLLISDERRRQGVAYLSIDKGRGLEPIGTVFFLDVRWGKRQFLTYAITAAHCVSGLDGEIVIEYTDHVKTEYRAIPTLAKDWWRSDKTDVACLLMKPSTEFYAVNIEGIVGGTRHTLHFPTQVGHDVFVVGLFVKSPYAASGEERRVEPIVRFGKISLVGSEAPVYVDTRDVGHPERAKIVAAHLVEMISFGGESGSPVFVYEEHRPTIDERELEKKMADILRHGQAFGGFPHFEPVQVEDSQIFTPLLGMISSHWQIDSEVRSAGRKKKVGGVGLNSGIATVIPASEIRDFIMNDQRLKRQREKIPQLPLAEPTVPLSAISPPAEPPFTKDDFEAALKKVSKRLRPSQSDEGKSGT